MYRLLFPLICLLATLPAFAQLPSTQVYVFDYSVRDTLVDFQKPLYLTAFNQEGYNNQPSWIDRNNLLMSVELPGQEQPDIYSFDLPRKTKSRLTATKAGEYSPKVMGAGQRFSAIRQEYIGRDTVLRLWEFPMNLENSGKPVFKNITNSGYYEWLNSVQVALFLVTSPNALVMAAADSENTQRLAGNTGRCFKRQPNGNLAFVDKSEFPYRIVEKNLYRLDEAPRLVTTTVQGAEDFAILTDGSYLMGKGSKIYRFDPIRNPKWVEVTDLRLYGIKNISRIETNGFGRLALVADGQ